METIAPKKTLAEETYDILVDAICNGDLAPGERLTQDEIAARLNVSRQPVNSAISILKTNRLVEDTGRRGVVVSPLDPRLFSAIFEFRSGMEPFAVRLAARKMPADAQRQAKAALGEGRRALVSGEVRALVDADMHFHEMLYRWGGNEVVESTMRLNWHHIRRGMAVILRQPGLPEQSWRDHAEIIEALFSGDVAEAEAAMARHIDAAALRVVTGLAEASA
jgi:DNA-binding GntR family transcriptional regulator